MSEYKEVKVLDKGFVQLIDTMGDDRSICQSARVSYSGGKLKNKSSDEKLIRYLMRNSHWSPFEMCQIKLHMKMPIFVARQFYTYRASSRNEISGRYSKLESNFFIPEESRIFGQGVLNKQGSEKPLEEEIQKQSVELIQKSVNDSAKAYEALLESGVSREISRVVLPTSIYTEFYWSMNLRNIFNFLSQRLDEHAQIEIREYAKVIYEIVKEWVPIALSAFEDYNLNATTFSAQEIEILRSVLQSHIMAETFSSAINKENNLKGSEKVEFLKKINKMV